MELNEQPLKYSLMTKHEKETKIEIYNNAIDAYFLMYKDELINYPEFKLKSDFFADLIYNL